MSRSSQDQVKVRSRSGQVQVKARSRSGQVQVKARPGQGHQGLAKSGQVSSDQVMSRIG